MTARYDVALVGLGAMGSATLYQLAKRGAKVIGLDRYEPPHDLGSSHGESRITRVGVGEGRSYVPFAQASQRIWRELEAVSGSTLFQQCGALVMGPGDGETTHHGMPDFTARSIASAEAGGVPHEVIDGAEVTRRFPMFLGLSGSEKAYYEPGGGFLMPEACIAAQLGQAGALGATIRTGVVVDEVKQDGSVVRLTTSDGIILADRVVVSAGAWSVPLIGPPFDRLLSVSRQLLHWFALDDTSAYRRSSPVYIWMYGKTDAEYFYGFPPLAGDPRVKVAKEQYETNTTATSVDRRVDPSESARMYRANIAGRLAGATSQVAKAAVCLYTVTPDRGFIIDRHPEQDRITVVSACSGHGFKHSAGLGEALAETLSEGRSRIDLRPFALDRFA
ncbi:N-methyl-L-tryptophan oxidase [Lichenihabitans sp. Uapishka_5]|uniref:N-methyl-L-tryptophan oxidase n=1 Tax=Lichenihabitans sp. Uapishka_5 TaxID=3037302 RepID=UPI0029E7EF29|nr:N-methyl-L-tryptophan oxidase [Lichenihabitans sp. Uapishka_5]MDX7950807.1 N-methyl-L-tryptophan oxidase [Lichenihabitans sp. Uapishka_5]